MEKARHDWHALFLLISLVVFLILTAFVEHKGPGEVILVCSMGVILVAAVLEVSENATMRWPGMLLAGASALVLVLCVFYPLRPLLVTSWVLLMSTFGFVVVCLFSYLGRPGRISRSRIYASVSLYLMIGIFYYALFGLIEALHGGSFVENGQAPGTPLPRQSLLYFSLVTLTTLGYGDITPVTRQARILASLEAVTGVLFIAITVARLVAAYQAGGDED